MKLPGDRKGRPYAFNIRSEKYNFTYLGIIPVF